MQDLNKDIDDLFRKAVDQYTLRPCENKWNEISGKISSKTNLPFFLNKLIKSKYARGIILFLIIVLIPIAMVSIFQKINEPVYSDNPAGETVIQKSKVIVPATTKAIKYRSRDKINDLTLRVYEIRNGNIRWPDIHEFLIINNNKLIVSDRSPTVNDAGRNVVQNDLVNHDDSVNTKINPVNFGYPILKENQPAIAGNMAISKKLPLQHLDPRRQGLYFGIALGPLLSQVKHEGLNRSGFDFGLVIGYALSNKFSVETGLMQAKQYYFVGGDYYNLVTSGHTVKSLQGNRTALKIPLTLRYKVVQTAGGSLFIAAGISSFIGVEDNILIDVGENPVPPARRFDYGATSFLPSYLDISIGYEFRIGKHSNIKLEPYMEIPLESSTGNSFKTNVNGGSIQVFNSGIHIAITRFIR